MPTQEKHIYLRRRQPPDQCVVLGRQSIAYTYDADSNRTSMADPHGTTSYTYDALDRLLPVVFLGGSTLTRINTGFLRYLKGKVKADFRHSRHTKGDALYSAFRGEL